jgi:hypothetical protein
MKLLTQFKTTIRLVRKPIRPVTAGFLTLLLLVCFGLAPMAQAVGPDTDGSIPGSNNGEGIGVLVSRTVGVWNTGTGFEALSQLTAGNQNTATGLRALTNDINGGFNTAAGVYSLFSNTGGFFNSATGAYSLANNTDGNYNTANGYAALYRNTVGLYNTATGFAALYRNQRHANTATGYQALFSNTDGDDNTADGYQALFSNTTGFHNTAAGIFALYHNTSGAENIALGVNAGNNVTTASNVICIGNPGENNDNSCYVGNIFGATVSVGTPVLVNSDGRLGTVTSSRRFKEEIKPMERASEALFALKPVTFHYKKGIDPQGIPQFGLVAEDVEKVNPDLVVRDGEGNVNTVRYEVVNAMLLNEFLKAHRKAQQQQATITELKRGIEILTAQLKEQAAQIQKVNAQLEISKPAVRTVLSNR